MISTRDMRRQDLVVGAIGGTVVGASTHRTSDILVGLLGALRVLAGLTVQDHNLASMAADAIADLHAAFPLAVLADGLPSAVVQSESDFLVEDLDALEAVSAYAAREAVWDALENVVGEATCYVDTEDGIGVYAIGPDDIDD
jgi:hypothetical protein